MKLVRDKIPAIIKQSGKQPVTRIAGDEEYLNLLLAKLEEEVNEFKESLNQEEMADIYEVLSALKDKLGWDSKKLRRLRLQKRQNRGGFTQQIVLESVK